MSTTLAESCGDRTLALVYKPIVELKANERNARSHSPRQIKQVAESIRVFGFTNPVLIDADNIIIAGHCRVEAAKLLKIRAVPTIRLDHLTRQQLRAYLIADNKLAQNAGWDKEILAIEFQELLSLDCADFDLTMTGFDVPEIDMILEEASGDSVIEHAIPDLPPDQPPVTEAGDLWQMGKHRIICGNSLYRDTYETLMGRRNATMVFADPPYNVRIDGHASGNGAIKHREFAMASGEMSELEFLAFLNNILKLFSKFSVAGSLHYVTTDWRHVGDLIAAGKQAYSEYLNLCVWAKNVGGMGSLYRSQHELILVFRSGKESHRNNVMLGKFGRNRTNVWNYPGIQTLSKQSDEGNLLAVHPCVKPVAMVADAILDCTARGDIVLDAFLGSGTTLMAAERVGRVCYGIEIDPLYIDVAIRRWQRQTGDTAIHASTGRKFNEVAAKKEDHHG